MDLVSNKESDSNITDEDECSQDDDRADGGGRRRFCNERAKQQQNQKQHHKQPVRPSPNASSSQSSNKRQRLIENAKTSVMSSQYKLKQTNRATTSVCRRTPYPLARPCPIRRPSMPYGTRPKPQSDANRRCITKKVFNTTNQPAPHDTVIYVNPKFIKKFLLKAMVMMYPTDVAKQVVTNREPVDSLSFQHYPADALQAAATMYIVRLVTECIEDDSERDEKSNKVLSTRLMSKMTGSAKQEPDNMMQLCHGSDLESKLSTTP